jgi:hypothetical protein
MRSPSDEISPEQVEAFEAKAMHQRAKRIMDAFDALPKTMRDKINAGTLLSHEERNLKQYVVYCLAHR